MWLPRFVKSLSLFHALAAVKVGPPPGGAPLKAVSLLGVERLAEARTRAEHALKDARRCSCCKGVLEHVYDRLGSTLFLDDDPEQLARAFDDDERDAFTARVLAACIVLSGRERVAAMA